MGFAFLLSFFWGSLIQHNSQLIEHGNLIIEGEWEERAIKARNLRSEGVLAKLFLFLTHYDAREHVLHHALVRIYSGPFPGRCPCPKARSFITLRDYLKIAWGMITKG